ncbi:hypothetical protein GM921_01960 [Pedobacter sp. LMG 31464]|uniref:Uncharacterized protein n=1 Tax=Pedobacter planticolens TaxID=2679964 RepID=A0A923IU02_9SPHI|nr:hypothetical protein [Pedobacter planticolens]MBB2144238.1 hypothetical protein [Pedobacter planticolens]
MQNDQKDISLAILYFLLSLFISILFISQNDLLYTDTNQMILSGSIAGAKWGIQIIAALFLLKKKKFEFIRRISLVCLSGSISLLSYYLLMYLPLSSWWQFVLTLIICVVIMLVLYFQAVAKTRIGLQWYFGWVACLIIAILLQLTIVFHIIT